MYDSIMSNRLRCYAASVRLRPSGNGAIMLSVLSGLLVALNRRFINYVGNDFETVTHSYRGKFTVFINSKYLIERQIFIDNYERQNVELMSSIVSPGDVVFEDRKSVV